MLNLNNVIFTNSLPKLDLHGYDRDTAVVLLNSFINDNKAQGINLFVVIHGVGAGILRKATHQYLSRNREVIGYKLDNFNVGCTIVEIRI